MTRITSTGLPFSSSSRTVWATSSSVVPPTIPIVCQRISPSSIRSCRERRIGEDADGLLEAQPVLLPVAAVLGFVPSEPQLCHGDNVTTDTSLYNGTAA